MAIKLIANYSKRLGLPGYSSHQFSVSVETELVATDDIPKESERLYHLLQDNVDAQMQRTGFVPPTEYGMDPVSPTPGNLAEPTTGPAWRCSEKQRDLILKLVEEHQLDKNHIEDLAKARFNKGVRLLNKIEASGLIDELIETHGRSDARPQARRNGGGAYQPIAERRAA